MGGEIDPPARIDNGRLQRSGGRIATSSHNVTPCPTNPGDRCAQHPGKSMPKLPRRCLGSFRQMPTLWIDYDYPMHTHTHSHCPDTPSCRLSTLNCALGSGRLLESSAWSSPVHRLARLPCRPHRQLWIMGASTIISGRRVCSSPWRGVGGVGERARVSGGERMGRLTEELEPTIVVNFASIWKRCFPRCIVEPRQPKCKG